MAKLMFSKWDILWSLNRIVFAAGVLIKEPHNSHRVKDGMMFQANVLTGKWLFLADPI